MDIITVSGECIAGEPIYYMDIAQVAKVYFSVHAP